MIKRVIVFTILLLLYSIFLCHKINLPIIDLGRHLKNGELVIKYSMLPKTNLYSYVVQDFPFINHHWLSGVIFWLLFKLTNFKFLTVFKLIIFLTTFSLSFWLAVKRSNFWIASFVSLLIMPLLEERTTIRPEMFSYLFVIIYIYFIEKLKASKDIKFYWLVFIQTLWVNLHIYFFIGILIILLGVIEKFQKRYLILIAFLLLASLINPFFIKGTFYPFYIMKNYGYDVVENKSPFFLEKLMIKNSIIAFKLVMVVLIISWLIPLTTRKISLSDLGLTLFFLSAAIYAIRNLSMFGFVILPIISANIYQIRNLKIRVAIKSSIAFIIFIILAILFLSSILNGLYYKKILLDKEAGLGLASDVEDSINFYLMNKIKGPIFNNYDIGSYLIYYLYPKQQVWVDNRPEAYPVKFFEIYKEMQENEITWKMMLEKYNFNVIYFSHTDATPWAQKFLTKRLHDPEWALVYVDNYAVIMLRRNKENAPIINKFEITKENIKSNSNFKFSSKRAQFQIARFYLLYNEPELAKEIYINILNKNPDDMYTKLFLGYLYSNSKKREDLKIATKLLEEAIRLGYKLPSVYNELGVIYFKLGEFSKAKQLWEYVLKKDKKNEHAKYYLKQYQKLIES